MCSGAVKWEGEDGYFEWNTDTQYENETFLCAKWHVEGVSRDDRRDIK